MGNMFTRYERDTIEMLEKPHALVFLVFWWLNTEKINADRKFLNAAGYGDGGTLTLPSCDNIFPGEGRNHHPIFHHHTSYRSRRVKPLLQFAWEHGFIAEVMAVQAALRAAGLDKYCIGPP
jgi:hypothetical protein